MDLAKKLPMLKDQKFGERETYGEIQESLRRINFFSESQIFIL